MLSGCEWAGIAYLIGRHSMMPFILGGIVASPFIGLLAGLVYRRACNSSLANRVFFSLLTLYLAAALFGLASGITDAFRTIPSRMPSAVIIQTVLATLWGVTFTGYVFLLWPLSFFNHALLCRFGGPDTRRHTLAAGRST